MHWPDSPNLLTRGITPLAERKLVGQATRLSLRATSPEWERPLGPSLSVGVANAARAGRPCDRRVACPTKSQGVLPNALKVNNEEWQGPPPESALGMGRRLWQSLGMSMVALDLQDTLNELDSSSASKLERLVRDAIALARPSKATLVETDAKGWPVGHFEKFAGCLADEEWEVPNDPPPDS